MIPSQKKISILGESSNFFNCDFVTAASKTAAACGAVSKINLLRVLPAEQNVPRKNTIGTRCHQHPCCWHPTYQMKKYGTCLCFTMYILSAIACWHHCWHVPAKASTMCSVKNAHIPASGGAISSALGEQRTRNAGGTRNLKRFFTASWGHDPRSWLPNGSQLLMAEHSKPSKTNGFHVEVIEGK